MNEISEKFGNRIRIRVCGILIEKDAILLAHHRNLGPANSLWIPPGGGVHFGESIKEALIREFREETGLAIAPVEFLTITEYINPPLHAVELFYLVKRTGSNPVIKGNDPELDVQLIDGIRFVTFDELGLIPSDAKHDIIKNITSKKELLNVTSGFKF